MIRIIGDHPDLIEVGIEHFSDIRQLVGFAVGYGYFNRDIQLMTEQGKIDTLSVRQGIFDFDTESPLPCPFGEAPLHTDMAVLDSLDGFPAVRSARNAIVGDGYRQPIPPSEFIKTPQ